MSLLSPCLGRWWRSNRWAFARIEWLIGVSAFAVLTVLSLHAIQGAYSAANSATNLSKLKKSHLLADQTELTAAGGLFSRPGTSESVNQDFSWVRDRNPYPVSIRVISELGATFPVPTGQSTDRTPGIQVVLDRVEGRRKSNSNAAGSIETMPDGMFESFDHYHFRRGEWTSFSGLNCANSTIVPIHSKFVRARSTGISQEGCSRRNGIPGFKTGPLGGSECAFLGGPTSFLSESKDTPPKCSEKIIVP